MKKLILLLLLIPFANPYLSTNPSSFDIELYELENYTYSVILENDYDFDLYNISFSKIKGVTFPLIEFMEKANITEELNASNHSINVTYPTIVNYSFSIYTNTTFENSYVSIISFLYRDYRIVEKKTYTIEIDEDGFHPNNLEVHQDDIIKFKNTGINNHSIVSTTGDFHYNLTPSDEIITNFSDIGEIQYYDEFSGYLGNLNITSKNMSIFMHSSTYNEELPIKINSKHQRAGISFSIFISNIELNHNSKAENVLNIVNSGDSKAYGIKLSGKWLDFEVNDIDLEVNKSRIVYFNITPFNITKTDQTGKDYKINITMEGNNFDNITQQMNVFIKYRDFSTSTTIKNETKIVVATKEFIRINMEEICEEYPDLCPKENITVEKIQWKEKEISVKASDFQRINDIVETWSKRETTGNTRYEEELRGVRGEMQDTRTAFNDKIIPIESGLENTQNGLSELNQSVNVLSEKVSKLLNSTDEIGYSILLVLILAVGIIMAYGYLSKRKKGFSEYLPRGK
jgi:plastocyanin